MGVAELRAARRWGCRRPYWTKRSGYSASPATNASRFLPKTEWH